MTPRSYPINIAAAALLALLIFTVQSCSMRSSAYKPLTPADEERALASIEGCGPAECFQAALKEMEGGEASQAAYKLNGLRLKFAGSKWGARSSFMLGLIALDPEPGSQTSGIIRTANPEELFAEALSLKEIKDYVLIYQARAYVKNELLEEAVSTYDRLLENYPASTLRGTALFERGSALARIDRVPDALEDFGHFAKNYPKSALIPEALIRLAEMRIETGEPAKAVPELQEIIMLHPTEEAAAKAEKLLVKLKHQGVDIQEPTPRSRFTRAKTLYKSARYTLALAELDRLASGEGSGYDGPATILKARTAIRLRRYKLAISTLNDYLNSPRTPGERLQGLFQLAVAGVRSDNLKLLNRVEKELKRDFPTHVKRGRVMLFKAAYYESHGNTKRAKQIYTRVMNEFKSEPGTDARWKLAWANYKTGDRWKLARANGLMSTYPVRSTPEHYRQRFLYWSARSLEKLGRTEEALKGYNRVCRVRVSYYCQLAAERRAKLDPKNYYLEEKKGPLGPAPYQTKAGPRLRSDQRYRAAVELLTLGLDEEAAAELAILSKKYAAKRQALLKLTGLLYKAGDYHRGLKLYFNHLGVISRGGAEEELARIAFPIEIIDLIRRTKGPGSADEYLVAAIMREESTFNPRAISRTGAVGLMQIMPGTGDFIAMKTRAGPVDREALLKPELNIRFGSWYLGYLARKFDNNLVFTIAGYNAGPKAVKRWAKNGPTEFDEFIEEIPYSETRAYAKRVIKSYTVYLKSGGIDPSRRFVRPIVDTKKVRLKDKDGNTGG